MIEVEEQRLIQKLIAHPAIKALDIAVLHRLARRDITLADIAMAENVTPAYAGRMLKLAYLAPAVLEKLLLERMAPAASIKEMAAAAELPWHRQITAIFNSEAATTLQPPSLSHSEPAG